MRVGGGALWSPHTFIWRCRRGVLQEDRVRGVKEGMRVRERVKGWCVCVGERGC